MKIKKIMLGIYCMVAILFIGFLGFDLNSNVSYAKVGYSGEFNGFTNLQIPNSTTEYDKGDTVKVDFYGDKSKFKYVSISMVSTTSDDKFEVYLNQDKNSFVIPDSVKAGEKYELDTVLLYLAEQSNVAEMYSAKNDGRYTYMNPGENKYITIKSEQKASVPTVEKISFGSSKAKAEDQVFVNLALSGKIDSISLGMKNITTNQYSIVYISDLGSHPYVQFSKSSLGAVAGEYVLDTINIFGPTNNQIKMTDTNTRIIIENETTTAQTIVNQEDEKTIKGFDIKNNYMGNGDPVQVDISSNIDMKSVLISFKGDEVSFNAYLKDLSGESYFVVPNTVKTGRYNVESVVIKDTNNKSYYFTPKNNTYLVDKYVKVNAAPLDKNKLTINNEDYDFDAKSKIGQLEDNAIITLNADANPSIDKTVFELIQGTNRRLIINYNDSEWVFNGKDINSPKMIDVSMDISKINDSEFKSSFNSNLSTVDTYVLDFADNGTLPGKSLIRIKSNELNKYFTDEKMYVYFYQEDVDALLKVAMEVQKNGDYYEFYVNHNSKYILSAKELTGEYVIGDADILNVNENVFKNKEETSKYAYINAIVILLIIGILLVSFITVFVRLIQLIKKK